MTQINAYITFLGNCREAMHFYQECLGGELSIQTVGESPIEFQCPAAMKNHVLHATLQKEGLLLMASEMPGPEGYIKGNSIALSLNCSSEAEIKDFFSRLAEGASIIHPLRQEFWGATFGVLTDKFGIRWMLNYDRNNRGKN